MRKPEPDERIDALIADFFRPPAQSEAEYEIALQAVAREMADA